MQIQSKCNQPVDDPALYLIDGHAVIYKYHFAYKNNPMVTSAGMDVSGVFGMAKLIATIIRNYAVTHIAVIFDPPCRTWRKDFYPEYKAGRKHPDDITSQLSMAYHLVKTWGIFTGAYKPLEADDVIGILSKKAEEVGLNVRIVSKDKDFCQLINRTTKLVDLGQTIGQDETTIIDRDEVKKRYGVWPEQIIDYLSLLGDSIDNVPGVEGVGKKGAADLLNTYGTIEGVYEHLLEFTPARQKNLTLAKEFMPRNRKLITLATHYDVPVQISDTILNRKHSPSLFELLEKWEMFSIIKILSN